MPRGLAVVLGSGLAAALALVTPAALADRVVVLAARSLDPQAGPGPSAIDIDVVRGLVALGHVPVSEAEMKAAVAVVADGTPDTAEEYRAVGAAARADWVLVAAVAPAVVSDRVELSACLVSLGRVESVAREVDKGAAAFQLKEMLALLVRPEGVGVGELPWERAPAPPKPVAASPVTVTAPPPPPPAPVRDGVARMSYFDHDAEVWPPYAAGRRFFVGVGQGIAIAAARPGAAAGDAWSIVGHARAGYALGDRGIEVFAQIGGNLAGPRALWIEGGARWMLTPSLHPSRGTLRGLAFHIGPELTVGAFGRLGGGDVTAPDGTVYGSESSFHPTVGLGLGMALQMSPLFQLEGQLGNLRWVPLGDEGSLVLFGATLGASLRF